MPRWQICQQGFKSAFVRTTVLGTAISCANLHMSRVCAATPSKARTTKQRACAACARHHRAHEIGVSPVRQSGQVVTACMLACGKAQAIDRPRAFSSASRSFPCLSRGQHQRPVLAWSHMADHDHTSRCHGAAIVTSDGNDIRNSAWCTVPHIRPQLSPPDGCALTTPPAPAQPVAKRFR